MRKLTVLFFLLMVVVLVACGGEDTENTNAGSDTPEQHSNNNKNSNIEEGTEEKDSPAEDSQTTAGAEEILKKSAEAMTEVTSFQVEGTIIDNNTIDGQNERSETNLTMETVLDGSLAMHAKSNTESNVGAAGEIEIYITDKIYVKAPEEQWFAMEKGGNEEMYNMFTILNAQQLDNYVNWSGAFDVADRGDHYQLSFTGDADMYKEIVMGVANSMSGDAWNDRYENMEIDGVYEITVAKDTYHMTGYLLEYEAETESDEELDDIRTYHKGTYTLQKFNQYEEIVVPEEVMEQAGSR